MMFGTLTDKRVTEEWIITWFPPEADRTRKFRNEQAARDFADSDEVAEWNPLMEHRVSTLTVKGTMVPLNKRPSDGTAEPER